MNARERAAVAAFQDAVWKYWKQNGRHDLPWRQTKDPYKILVSEVMLQQTQVPRVLEKYKEFLKTFPDVASLGRSDLSQVLRIWSGLGYNRRGKFLRDAAIAIAKDHKGKVPRDASALRTIPGIGPYTASAILIFAFNIPDTLIETNVRSAYIHHFFKGRESRKVNDRELLPFLTAAAEGQDPRKWHWALMDYGSYLKKAYPNPSRRSAHHAKQSKFEGSLRQVRGAILRELHKGSLSQKMLSVRLSLTKDEDSGARIKLALKGLVRDGLVVKSEGKWQIV